MPPERFDGWSDPRSDIYSLGLTLYELLTLEPAFAETRQERLIQQILRAEPRRPRQHRPELPIDLETIVLKAIAREPGHRYRTADELAEDLRLFLAHRPIKARRITWAGKTWRWCQRNPTVSLLLGSIAALLIIIAAGASWNAHSLALERDNVKTERDLVAKERDNVLAERKVAVANLRQAYLVQAQAARFSGKPGRNFASMRALTEAAQIRPGLDLRNEAIACMVLPDLRPLCRFDVSLGYDRLACTAFDSDLAHFAYSDPDESIVVRRTADHAQVFAAPTHGAQGLMFSPGDRYLAALHATRGLKVWDLREKSEVLHVPTAPGNGLQVSPSRPMEKPSRSDWPTATCTSTTWVKR